MSFLAELKRRKVIKVGGAYLVVAWLVVQAASIGFPVFEAPPWALRVFIFVVMLGFPIALVFAWAFDMTADGLKAAPSSRASVGVFLVAAALTTLAVAWYFKGQPSYRASDVPASEGPSVAVLPFANVSGKPDEEYFSDGMTEELLNVLARVPQLKVAARTSVFEFKGRGGDVREIGRKLGVSHIVEGSVRREGEQVRVTAQLVRVADGFHVWSESYERELKSVFALQDDIASHIAEQLQSTLGVTPLPARAAIDPVAYDEYLKGRTLYRQRKDLPQAIAHLQAALSRAPQFAAGWASLSLAHDLSLWYTKAEERAPLGDPLDSMRIAAERAAALDPDAALTLHAQANVARAETRYADAERLYLRAIEADPSYADVREDHAELLINAGRPQESLIAARDALQLDPFVPIFWWRLGVIGAREDRRELVNEAQERIRAIDPTNRYGALASFYLEFWQGRLDPARAALAEAMQFAPAAAALDALLFRWSQHEQDVDDAEARRTIVGRPDYAINAVYRGDPDLYFAAFDDERARALRYCFYAFTAMPAARPLLADPRAKDALKRYGFVAYWREKGWPALCQPLGENDFECGSTAGSD